MDFLMPQPDEIGIANTKEIVLRKYGRVLTDDEAREILGKIMRYLFLMNNIPPVVNHLKDQFSSFKEEAFRVEMLPKYSVLEENEVFTRFLTGETNPGLAWHQEWLDSLDTWKKEGKRIIRLRVVPRITPYLKFEFLWGYPSNIEHSEEVYVISVTDFATHFPGITKDFWLFDKTHLVSMGYYAGGYFRESFLSPEQLPDGLAIREKYREIAVPFEHYMQENASHFTKKIKRI